MLAKTRSRIAAVSAVVPRSYWFIWWGTLVNRLGGFVVPLLMIYLTEVRSMGVAEAGGVVSVFGAGHILASYLGGELADRLGRRITMLISLFGGAIAMLVLGFVRDITAIVVMVGLVGLFGELYRPAVLAFVSDVVPQQHRMAAYGLLYWVINVGFAFAAVVGGLLAELDFTILFVADAVTMIAYGVIVLVAVPETRPARLPQAAHVAPSRAWFRDRDFVVFAVLTFFMTLLPLQSSAPLAAHMASQGFGASAYGLVMAINGLLIIALQPSITEWSGKRDTSNVLVAAALLYGIGFALHGAYAHVAMHAVAVAVWTMAEILESPTRSTIVAAMAPDDARGRYQGALVMMWGVAQLVSPKLGTSIWEYASPSALWLGCLGLAIVVAGGYAVTAAARRRRIASGPNPSGSS